MVSIKPYNICMTSREMLTSHALSFIQRTTKYDILVAHSGSVTTYYMAVAVESFIYTNDDKKI